jgi:hypothetical protein
LGTAPHEILAAVRWIDRFCLLPVPGRVSFGSFYTLARDVTSSIDVIHGDVASEAMWYDQMNLIEYFATVLGVGRWQLRRDTNVGSQLAVRSMWRSPVTTDDVLALINSRTVLILGC